MASERIQRVGGRETIPLAARIVFVSARGLPDLPSNKSTQIAFPNLRQRHLDIRMILENMIGQLISPDRFPDIRPAAFRVLSAHDWPGNETELRHLAQVLARLPASSTVEAHDMALYLHGPPEEEDRGTARGVQRQQILQVLARNDFRKGATARALNISRKTLYNRMKRLGLTEPAEGE